LRTAENDFKYGDKNWNSWMSSTGSYSHLHAQVFSGLLWSIRKGTAAGQKVFDTVVMRAISALPQEGGFTDFLKALEEADQQYAAGQSLALLANQINLRNLAEFAKIDVSRSQDPVVKSLPDSARQPTEATVPDQPVSRRGHGSRSPSCGVVGALPSPRLATLFLLIFPMLLPLIGLAVLAPRRHQRMVVVDKVNKIKYIKNSGEA
jgi:hypothetical protein